jgi:protein-S-isoprenylcysteine O-methyltransferase Ste14
MRNIVSSGNTGCRVQAGLRAWTPCRNPMYLGHLIFMAGLVITFRSWFALILLVARAMWFQRRVLHDEARLERQFGVEYSAYRGQVKRWLPFAF